MTAQPFSPSPVGEGMGAGFARIPPIMNSQQPGNPCLF